MLLIGRWMEETANYEPNRVIQQYKVTVTVIKIYLDWFNAKYVLSDKYVYMS